MEKREPQDTVGGNVNWCSHYEKQYGVSSKEVKIELPYDPSITGYISKENTNSKRYMHPNVFSSIIYNRQDMETT